MNRSAPAKPLVYLPNVTARKVQAIPGGLSEDVPDALAAWATRYLALAVVGVRSPAVTQKITLHLDRFIAFFLVSYGHDRIGTCLRRDVLAWQRALTEQGLAPATVNNHLASLSAFTTWVAAQAPAVFPVGDPAKGIRELGLPPLEPRALTPAQVRSLKNLCDRLERFHRLKGQRWATGSAPVRAHGRPWRDRAIIYVLLSTGLRREELLNLNLDQLVPNSVDGLRQARQGRLTGVQGKGGTERTVFLSADARQALADYLDKERPRDAGDGTPALFLTATGIPARRSDGRLSLRAVNLILEQIGRWHDAELKEPTRHVSPLRPHDLRHTFAFHLAQVTGADAYELERRLGHRSQRYIQRYTNPPEEVAAAYVEEF
jgi:integrase